MSVDEPSPAPSYEELAEMVVVLTLALDRANTKITELEARLGKDSTNSSQPSSKDPIGSKARQRADLSSRERSADRKPGGQLGRAGVRLKPTEAPTRTERVADPVQCGGCGADLGCGSDAGVGWAQVWDVLPAVLEKVAYVLPRRRCGCGTTTMASPPCGQAGTVSYGPNLNAAAILLCSEGNVPVERTAMLIGDLLGVSVSPGFVARAVARLAERLQGAGFDEAMRVALRAEEVLCGDETPVNLVHRAVDALGRPLPGAPHVVALRSTDARLVWYAVINARTSIAIAGLDVLSGWSGFLVRDDYAGWVQFDATLAGVQQCCAHLIRHSKGVWLLHRTEQGWANTVITVLREAAAAVAAARVAGLDYLDPALLADLRERYDEAVNWGVLTNRLRDWPKGNHPGYNLARRLAAKVEQVWLFTTNFKIPWTNNASEQALKGPKRHQAVSGYWLTPDTLAAYCRVRSYLVSARGHGVTPLQAIRRALTSTPWLPMPA